MEPLEIRLLDEWFKNLRRWGTYNRKWWPDLAQAKKIGQICNEAQPHLFIEVGTGNGVTASYVAAYGTKVVTFDPADRPKVYLDETFPLKHLYKHIHFINQTVESSLNYWTSKHKAVWSIDGMPGEKSIASYLLTIRPLANKDDLLILNGRVEKL